jgi:two-component system phosphate regulon sensor histidine kinase PhoR
LRRSALILLVAALVLAALVVFGGLQWSRAIAAFVCIAGAALVPWQLHEAGTPREPALGANPVETAAVYAIVAGMPDPNVLLDRAGRVIHLNAAAAQLVPALRRNELAQFALRSPEIVIALREAIATRETRRTTYLNHVPVDRWMELIITPVPVPTAFGGIDHCMLLTFHDQTPLRRVEEMRADFVANASHELRTPLAALSGFIDTLQGPAREDAKARERFLGIMHAQATRMARLIDDLLSLSRIELNEHTPPAGQVRLNEIIRTIVDGLEFKAAGKQITIVIDAPPPDGAESPIRLDDLPAVSGDDDELTQVFQNLIDNAIKYGRAGSTVRIAGWAVGPAPMALGAGAPLTRRLERPSVAVAVMDEGEGIAREHLPRLTERFYRIDTARSRELGGTGLGLAIVKHILNRHRGALDIDSVVGQGSTFTVHLPMAPDHRGMSADGAD